MSMKVNLILIHRCGARKFSKCTFCNAFENFGFEFASIILALPHEYVSIRASIWVRESPGNVSGRSSDGNMSHVSKRDHNWFHFFSFSVAKRNVSFFKNISWRKMGHETEAAKKP